MTQPFRARVWQQGFNREDQAKVVLEREDGQPFTIAEAQDMVTQVTTLRTTVPRSGLEYKKRLLLLCEDIAAGLEAEVNAKPFIDLGSNRSIEIIGKKLDRYLRADALAPPVQHDPAADILLKQRESDIAYVQKLEAELAKFRKVEGYPDPEPPSDALDASPTDPDYGFNESATKGHLLDVYAALGVTWGDDPFPIIERLRAACADQPWQPLTDVSPARERELWFWIRPKTAEETYHDTSGRPILSAAPPRLFIGKRGTWPSLMTATHWMEPNWPAPPSPAAKETL